MKSNKIQHYLLILYFYIHSYLVLFKIRMTDSWILLVELSVFLLMFLIVLIINNWKIKRNIAIFLGVTVLLLFANLFLTDSFSNVLTLAIRIIITILPPLYIITEELIDYKNLLEVWYKIALFNLLLLPVYYFLRSMYILQYIDIAEFTYVNCIILFYQFLMSSNKNVIPLIALIPNFLLLLVAGSRMILIATIVVFIVILFFLNHSRTLKYYFNTILTFLFALIVALNLETILISLSNWITKFGISSRNINLFLQFIRGAKFEDISSGRDTIYDTVINYIFDTYGFPHGIGKVYSLTNGEYYHSHNILLETVLTFGILITLILLALFCYKLVYYYKKRNNNKYQFRFFVLISCPYLVRSLVGTYFLTDTLFLIMFSLLLTRIKKEDSNENFINLIH